MTEVTVVTRTYQLDKGHHTYHVVDGGKGYIKLEVGIIARATRVLDLEFGFKLCY